MSQRFERSGVGSEVLDEIVHDVASSMAANANNGGPVEQLQFLAQAGHDESGIGSESLDETAHDVASSMAANANNGGLPEQLQFLAQAGHDEYGVWALVLKAKAEQGLVVEVSDPKHADSPHSSGFEGTVVEVCDEYVIVRDMEDNVWDVAFDEIERADFSQMER